MTEQASQTALGVVLGAMLFASTATAHPAHRSETRASSSSQANEHTSAESHVTRATARSAEDLLRDTPGLFLQRHSSEAKGLQLFVRGFDAQHGTDVEMRIDRIPVNQGSHVHGHGYIDLVWLPTLLVEEVNYIGGAYRVDQGPFSTAASVELSITNAEALALPNPDSNVRLELQSTHRGRFAAGALTFSEGTNFQTLFGAEIAHDRGTGARRESTRISALGRLRWQPTKSNTHELTLATGHAFFDVPTLIRENDLTNEIVNTLDTYLDNLIGETSAIRLSWSWDARPQLGRRTQTDAWMDIRAFQYLDNNTGYLLDERGDTQRQAENRISLGLQNLTRLHLPKRRQLVVSSSLRFEHVDNSAIRVADIDSSDEAIQEYPVDNLWKAYKISQTSSFAQERANRSLEANLLQSSFGLSWVTFAGAKFRSDLSIRADGFFVQAKDDLQASEGTQAALRVLPRWKGQYRLNEHVTFSSGVGMGVRPAEARSILRSDGDTTPRLRPTTSTSGDIGVSLHYDAVHLQVSGFGAWVTNEALFDHVSGLMWMHNATRRLGVEASAEVQVLPWLSLSTAWTAVDARYVDSGKRVPAAPRTFGFAQANITPHRNLTLEVKGRFAGPRDLRYDGQAEGWARVDVRGSWKASDRIEIGVSIENLTDSRHAEAVYNYASHWNLNEPVSVLPRLHALYSAPLTAWFDLKLWL